MPVACNAGGALCAVRSALQEGGEGGADRLASTSIPSTRVREVQHSVPPPPLCAPLSQERQHKQTWHQVARPGRGKGRSAVPAGRGHLAPECTVRQAATTGRMHRNCAVQPSIPYAAAPSFHIYPTVPQTAELPATSGLLLPNIWCRQVA